MAKAREIALILVVIGICGIAFNNIFGYNTITYLERIRDPSGYWYYKYNFGDYFKNLQNSLTVNFEEFVKLPTRQWRWDTTINNWWEILVNNLAVVYNYLVVIWNWGVGIVWHLGAWLLSNILAILGFDMSADYTGQTSYWFITLIQELRNGVFNYI